MELKKELIFTAIGSVGVIILLIYTVFQYQITQAEFLASLAKNEKQTMSTQKTEILLNQQEVAKHNTPTDCWIIINQVVYNASKYSQFHPNGAEDILKMCGQDATIEYQSIKRMRGHSQRANEDLAKLEVGKLNGTISQTDLTKILEKELDAASLKLY